jgi:hypothetical protein
MHMQIDGFCVIPGVIPKDDVSKVLESVERTTKMLVPDHFPDDGEEPGQWTEPDFVENGKEARPRGLLNHARRPHLAQHHAQHLWQAALLSRSALDPLVVQYGALQGGVAGTHVLDRRLR